MPKNRQHVTALVAGSPSATEMGLRRWPDVLGIGETLLVMHATDSPYVADTAQSAYHDEEGRFFVPAGEVLADRWVRTAAHALGAEVCFEPGEHTVRTARGEGREAETFLVLDGLKIGIKPHREIDGVKKQVRPVVFPDSEHAHGAVIVFGPDRTSKP